MNTGKQHRAPWRAAPPGLRLGLTVIKGIGLGTVVALVVVGGLQTTSSGGTGTASVDEAYQRVVERTVADHRCSSPGFAERAHTTSALIRTARGDVHVVSFEKGWDVYNGKRPGDLIAVCAEDRETAMDPAPSGRQRIKS